MTPTDYAAFLNQRGVREEDALRPILEELHSEAYRLNSKPAGLTPSGEKELIYRVTASVTNMVKSLLLDLKIAISVLIAVAVSMFTLGFIAGRFLP
jgi:hypothetical protein